jgi:hypothetical protein
MVSLTLAAAAKVLEAVFAFLLYRKPMIEIVGGPAGARGASTLKHCWSPLSRFCQPLWS